MPNENDKDDGKVEITGPTFHVKGKDEEIVHVTPIGVHVKDGRSEVKVGFTGIYVRDAQTGNKVSISFWKPFAGCAFAFLLFVALVTAVVAGIVRLILG
jgi:hypothetical protein